MEGVVALNEVTVHRVSNSSVASVTKSLVIEGARYGICVNAIASGYFDPLTEMLVSGTPRGQEILSRIPTQRFGELGTL